MNMPPPLFVQYDIYLAAICSGISLSSTQCTVLTKISEYPGRKPAAAGMLSFLRGSGPKEASPSLPRKAELVDSVKYTPASDMDSVEIGKTGFVRGY